MSSPPNTTAGAPPTEPPSAYGLNDRRIAALAAASGSAESVSRGQWLAAGMVVVGMLGALGVALRPIYRHHFASRAAAAAAGAGTPSVQRSADAARRAIAREAGEVLPPEEQARLQAALERLAELQSAHRSRHPLWYGDVPPRDLEAAAVAAAAGVAAAAAPGEGRGNGALQ